MTMNSLQFQARLHRAHEAWQVFARNRLALVGLGLVVLLAVLALFAPWLAPFDPTQGELLSTRLLPPSGTHWMGTDD